MLYVFACVHLCCSDDHLRLIFSLLEISPLPTIRANIVIALGDL